MTTDTLEAESAVCGAILLDDRCLADVCQVVSEDDFALEANRAIFRAALALDRRKEPVDPVTVLSEAGGAVSREYLMELMQVTPTAANVLLYARKVREESMRRAINALGDRLGSVSVGDNPRDTISDAQRALEAIEAQDTARELASSAEVMAAYYRHREQVDGGGGGFVPTGFRPLDRILGGGLLNSGLYILAARPGMGKTTFGLQVADAVAKQTGPVLFVSLEMDVEQLGAKRIARAAGVAYDALMMGRPTEEEYGRAAQWAAKLQDSPMYTNRKDRATVDDIAHMARQVRGLQLLVVDYFGLIKPTGRGKSRYETTTETSGQLKALARRLRIPVLCLAQLNRQNEETKNKRPVLSNLRDTGALEQDADAVIFLHCPSYYSQERPDPWSPDPMEIIVAKNRHAGTGICDAAFYRAVGRIIPAR